MFKKLFFAVMLSIFLFALPVHAEERISNFVSNIKINSDATFHVQEKINYDFGESEKHGIYRDIPYEYNINGKKYSIDIDNISVADENNNAINFVVDNSNGQKNIKIGDADVLLTGQKIYVIDYDIKYGINYFEDHDELYWNVTGNDWDVAIDNVSASIDLPNSSAFEDSQIACYVGFFGSTDECSSFEFKFLSNTKDQVNGATFSATLLNANDGMTVVFGFAKNIVPMVERVKLPVWQMILFLFGLPIATFVIMFCLWYFKGRDKNFHDPIIAQYDSPDNLPPGIVGTILDEKVDKQDISSEIIYMAIAGYFKINRIENKILVFKTVDYQLDKLKDADDNLKKYQKTLFNAFFKNGTSIKLSDLKYTLYEDFKTADKEMYNFVVDNEYFVKNPATAKSIYYLIGIAFIALAVFIFSFSLFAVTNLVISGIIIIIFSFFMAQKTIKGVKTRNYILGLKEYIRVAEKERIKFHNAPEKNPQTFEKFLPYAIVFKLENQWAKQFEGIYLEQPTWYSGANLATFSAVSFVSDLNNFGSLANTSFAKNSGSSSGFGGGSSGGGFGGGGGGSW
ncbi:MAG: hypothetical protein COY69_00910 [Candidatus Magasanikbacteria bacterium CG_4_10_14_0_8_um_filter_32_14]|uniref:DUF2207 domain-containing protein n=1 Tax=Candidatus Magasanikbacteria bacterium CG_4_10_14_0_8_um_filter_32_14 TaxID=1974640 RepID=A0A2M7R9X2_9BACT|nr:MAG: hypothetical protein COY69_00910 [Candidatus Magasanikbacteria bacterium CG_4_10_14_0_8_um_filter_32_14]